MYCVKCGQELPDSAAFCLRCGSQVAPASSGPGSSWSAPASSQEEPQTKEIPILLDGGQGVTFEMKDENSLRWFLESIEAAIKPTIWRMEREGWEPAESIRVSDLWTNNRIHVGRRWSEGSIRKKNYIMVDAVYIRFRRRG